MRDDEMMTLTTPTDALHICLIPASLYTEERHNAWSSNKTSYIQHTGGAILRSKAQRSLSNAKLKCKVVPVVIQILQKYTVLPMTGTT